MSRSQGRDPTSRARSGSALPTVIALLGVGSLTVGLGALFSESPSEVAPPGVSAPAPQQDTVRVYGPAQFDIPSGSSALHVEQFSITYQEGARYRLVVTNGDGAGSSEVSTAAVGINGTELISDAQALPTGATSVDFFGLLSANDLTVDLTGSQGGFVTVDVFRLGTAATTVFGPVELIRDPGPPNEGTWTFDLPDGVVGPFGLHVNSGFSDGSARATAAWVELNGAEIFGAGAFGQAVGYLEAEVALLDSANVLDLRIAGAKGSRIEVFLTGLVSDTTAPVITITAPEMGLVTSDDSVTVTGTVSDGTSVTVEVNGVSAQIVGDSLFTAVVPLTTDGLTVIQATATDASGNQATASVTVTRDTSPPTLTVTQPADSLITASSPTPLVGLADDVNGAEVVANGVPIATDTTGAFADSVSLVEGANVVTVTATDPAGNQAVEVRTVILDTSNPVLVVTAPADSSITSVATLTVSGSVTDATPVAVDANGVPLPVDGAGSFTGDITLSEGANLVSVTATDAAGNSVQTARIVTLDSQVPVLTVSAPADGSSTQADSVDVTGTVTDATAVTLTLNGQAVAVDGAGSFSRRTALAIGANVLALLATDAAGNTTADTVTVTRDDPLPPDPSLVASPIPQNVVTTIGNSTAFLYEGANPIQTGVAPGTIDPVRAAVVRGRVLDRAGQPIGGVTVSVLGRPEFGQTLTRADGAYDLAVNGGGLENVRFAVAGYPEVQRRTQLPWQDFVVLDDVVMTPLDSAVTVIDFTDPIQVAQGTPQTDADGTRQATLMFRQGTTVTMTLPGGAVDTLSSISVRATEYTVGADGQLAMPAALPPTTVYTYAVELSADEAIAAGAERVEFSQPVSFYLDNFLDIPVGLGVPVGYFDRVQGEWLAEQDGRVIEVVSIDSLGVAALNIDTIPGAEHPDTLLAHLGIDGDELAAIGAQYAVGDELWRGRTTHFSPFDYNFSARLTDIFNDVWEFLQDPYVPDWLVPDDCTGCQGSIINVEGQYVDERVPVVGTPYSLNYSSLRVPGRASSFRLEIPVFGDSVPALLQRATLDVHVAGQSFRYDFTPDSAITQTFVWDGRDAYGRLLFGQQPYRTVLTYYFEPQIMLARIGGGGGGSSFGQPGGGGITAVIFSREEPGVTIERDGRIGTRSVDRSLAGWSLDVHHSYDPIAARLYLGDGSNRSAASGVNAIGTIAGTGQVNFDPAAGEDSLATRAPFSQPLDVAVRPDGAFAVLSGVHDRVRLVDTAGVARTIAGQGGSTPDSIPAVLSNLGNPESMAYGPDGSLWITGRISSASWLYHVRPDGIILTYGGARGFAGDGGPVDADSVRFADLQDVAVAPDGSVYVLHGDNTNINCLGGVCRRLRRIGPDGTLSTVAGTGGPRGQTGDGGPATSATFFRPGALAVGPDGSIYVGDRDVIRRITPDGIIERFAGDPAGGVGFGDDYDGDGGPALDAQIFVQPRSLAVGRDGSVYFSQDGGALRVITAQGIIHTIAGTGVPGFGGDGGRALAAQLNQPVGLAIAPDGAVLVADAADNRVRRLGPALPGFDAGGHLIASEDGAAVHQFTAEGQHIQTLSALTGATLYSFSYDAENRLVGITDGDGLQTVIGRSVNGEPESITGPFGQVTTLAVDANGYLASVTNPASETHAFETDALGLLQRFVTPRADTTLMTYDPEGRLIQHVDPVGRVSTLARTEGDDFLQVQLTRGTRTSTYRVETDSAGSTLRRVTDPAGNVSETVEGLNGVTTATTPDGSVRTSTEGPDARFGVESPIVANATLGLPSSLASNLFGGRRVELTDTLDPLSLVSVLDTVTLNGRTYRSAYDAATRTLTSTTPVGRQTVSVLDSLERLTSHSVSGLTAVGFTYDGSGLLTQATQGARNWTFDYDASGRLQAATDPLLRSDSLFYDGADRVTRQVLADGEEILYGYDAGGNLTSLTPPGRPAHTFSYNGAGLDSIYNPPDVAGLSEDRTFYTYNANRELERILRPDGEAIEFGYDAAGRVDTVSIARGTLSYAYSPGTGQLTDIAAPGGEGLAFGYDGVLPTTETWTGTVSGTVGFGYDADLRLSGLSVNGDTVEYGYDGDGLLTVAGALTLTRDASNGLLTETALENVTTRMTYDGFGEPTADSAWVGATLVYARTYERDALGRLTEVVDASDGTTTVWGYGYDAVGRLATVTRDSVAYASYGYDANGNRLTRTTGSGTETGVYDAQDRLTSYGGATYTYTAAGELSERVEGADTTRYDYDALGNLIEVELPDGTVVAYTIDGRNRRVGRSVDGAVVQGLLYGDQLNPVAELDSTGAVVSRFVYGTKANVPDYVVRGGATYRVLSDHLGSVRLVVDATTGSVAQRLSYDAWGRVLEDTSPGFQPFGFAGGITDPLTGLVRFGARDYDPSVGRWTSKDPIGFGGGVANLYSYVDGDPVQVSDPTGADFRERFTRNLESTNSFFFGGLSSVGRRFPANVLTSGAVARGLGTVSFGELLRVLPRGGYPLLGGAVGTVSTYAITFVVNSILVAGALEVGIVIGSALDAAFCQELQTSFDFLYGLGERVIAEGREFF